MKTKLIDVGLGILVIIVVTIFEFLVTLPFGESLENRAGSINLELLLTAIPALLVNFTIAWLARVGDKSSAMRKSIIWTACLVIYYALIGLGNNNFTLIFGSIGVYVLLICSFAGPLLYAQIKKLK